MSKAIDGVPVYGWGAWPDHLLTKKQMSDAGFQTGKNLPDPAGAVYRKKSPGGVMWLYDRNQGVPKRTVSPRQQAALDKAQYMAEEVEVCCARCGDVITWTTRKRAVKYADSWCQRCHDRLAAAEWANDHIQARDFVVLDSETTALDGEVCEIAVIDPDGQTLLNTLVLPKRPWIAIESGAYAIHSIHPREMARKAPGWPTVWRALERVIAGKSVLVYNASFDRGMVNSMNRLNGIKARVSGWECIMEWYAQYFGEWSDHWHSYKWQPLNGGHRALGDCHAALAVMRGMAEGH